MPSSISIGQLADTIETLLTEYTEEVVDEVYDAVFETAQETRLELRTTSPERTGKYSRGWRVRKVRGANFVRAAVHNLHYRRVHLLEKGHAKRNGGRVRAIPHVGPAGDAAEERLERRIRRAVEGA